MKQDINLQGVEFFPNLVRKHINSFAYVTSDYGLNTLKQMMKNGRDFDVLEESLGIEI